MTNITFELNEALRILLRREEMIEKIIDNNYLHTFYTDEKFYTLYNLITLLHIK